MRNLERTKSAEQKWREGCALEDQGKIGQAIRRYKVAAQMGNVSAMSNLGNLLDDKARPSRPKEAVYWYRRAAKRGHSVAAWNLAMHYRNVGQQRWYLYWLRIAAELGDEDARLELRKQGH